jgi:transposase-like protein
MDNRDPKELVRELGVGVAPSTILRWVIRYVPNFEKYWQAHERPGGEPWRMDLWRTRRYGMAFYVLWGLLFHLR